MCGVSGGIFLLRGDDELVEMRESPYEAEDVLQALIARFPSLLAGDQYSGDIPRRWLLVGREAALPDDEDAAGRWSVDHLFLDQDAVPTLVEVKRSSDTRIRREVVGQMLDYAANGVVYWPLEQLREIFARQCERDDRDPDLVVSELAGRGDRRRGVLGARRGEPARGEGPHGVRLRRDPARAASRRRVPKRTDEPRRGHRDRGQAIRRRRRHQDARAPRDRPDRRGGGAQRPPHHSRDEPLDREALLAIIREQSEEAADAAEPFLTGQTASRGLTFATPPLPPVFGRPAVSSPASAKRTYPIVLQTLSDHGEPWDKERIEQFAQELADIGVQIGPNRNRPSAPL